MTRRGLWVVLLSLLIVGCDRREQNEGPRGGEVLNGAAARDIAAQSQLKNVPPLTALGSNAARVVIKPSFSDYTYLIDFAPQPQNCLNTHDGNAAELRKIEHPICEDVLVTYSVFGAREKEPPPFVRRAFHIPIEDWRDFSDGLDRRMDRWRGALCCTLDGTYTTVMRVRDGDLRAVANNDAEYSENDLGNPAYFGQTQAQRLLLMFGPAGTVPRSTDWTVFREEDPASPCSPMQFATPDPDGWGVGEDRCAKSLSRKR